MKSSGKLLLAIALTAGLFASASATDFYIEGRSSGEIYENGDQVRYVADTEQQANFTSNITQAGVEIAMFHLELQETFEQDNTTHYRYTSPYRINKSEFGIQTAHLWNNVSKQNENNVIESSFNLSGNLSYRVTDDHPNIIALNDYPSIKFTRSSINVEAEIADSDENVNSAVLEVDGRTFDMNLSDSRDNFQSFRSEFTINKTGSYDYSVTVQDNNSLQSSGSGSFYVEQVPRSDDTNVSVTVNNECYNVTSTLSAPGNEPLNWIRSNTSGAFLGKLYNRGSLSHDLNVSLDVTDEGNESWDSGDEPGPVIVSYLPKVVNLTGYNTTEYYRQFEAAYEPGNYTGRMHVDTSCSDPRDNITKEFNYTITDNFEIVATEGEDSELTNGSQTVNQTLPADSTRRGAESDQTLEGDNAEPGSTVEPRPEPRPELSLNMETANLSYSTPRGRYQQIGLNITNYANVSMRSVQINPQTADLEGTWESRSASITSIAPEQDLNREVFLRPGSDVSPGRYRIPILASLPDGRALDVEYATVEVTEEEVPASGLSIVEIPRTFSVTRNDTATIPLLVRNTGEKEMQDISLSVQNIEDCGKVSTESIDSLGVNETGTIQVELSSGQDITKCQTLFVLSSQSGAYSFANVNLSVKAEEGIVPPKFRVPLIAFAWTAALILYALLTRRYDLNSMMVKFPFLLLILGESVIVLYLAANYYGLIPNGVLPF
jgi:hypothetical protein